MSEKIEIKSNCIIGYKMIISGFRTIELDRLECESFQDYMERCYFVVNNLKNGKYDYDNLVNMSLLFHSIKVLRCSYEKQRMNEIIEMCKYAGVRLEK